MDRLLTRENHAKKASHRGHRGHREDWRCGDERAVGGTGASRARTREKASHGGHRGLRGDRDEGAKEPVWLPGEEPAKGSSVALRDVVSSRQQSRGVNDGIFVQPKNFPLCDLCAILIGMFLAQKPECPTRCPLSSQMKHADQADDNQVDRDNEIEQTRHDENENAGDQRDQG